MPMRVFRTSRTSVNPHKSLSVIAIVLAFKTSATASSYVFLQQEIARGLRLSQPSCVAKDAAWRALGFAVGNLSPAAKRCLTADAVVRCAAAELTRRHQRRPQHSERERGAVAAKRANTR